MESGVRRIQETWGNQSGYTGLWSVDMVSGYTGLEKGRAKEDACGSSLRDKVHDGPHQLGSLAMWSEPPRKIRAGESKFGNNKHMPSG